MRQSAHRLGWEGSNTRSSPLQTGPADFIQALLSSSTENRNPGTGRGSTGVGPGLSGAAATQSHPPVPQALARAPSSPGAPSLAPRTSLNPAPNPHPPEKLHLQLPSVTPTAGEHFKTSPCNFRLVPKLMTHLFDLFQDSPA